MWRRSLSSLSLSCSRNRTTTTLFSSPSSPLRSFHTGDRHDENEARDDDEFIFPVQFVSNSEVQYHWSGAEITRDCFDFNSSDFLPEKILIYNQKKMKVVQVAHKTDGAITFTLIQDRQKQWKICNIFKFGLNINQRAEEKEGGEGGEYSFAPTRELFVNFLQELNPTQFRSQQIRQPVVSVATEQGSVTPPQASFLSLTKPYQFIQPPFSVKNKDKISNYFQLPYANTTLEYVPLKIAESTSASSADSALPVDVTKEEDDYDYHEEEGQTKAKAEVEKGTPKVLLRTSDQVLLETHLQVKDAQGTVLSIIDLLLLVVNADTPAERIASVMIGGEQKIRRPRMRV
jgi:hypothetical protein